MERLMYNVTVMPKAKKEILAYKKAGNKVALARINRIIEELEIHPESGIGKPERLKHSRSVVLWSREIDKKNRMTYEINEYEIKVLVLSAMYHYDDK